MMRAEFSQRIQINERARRIAADGVTAGSLVAMVVNGVRAVGQSKEIENSPAGQYIFEAERVQNRVLSAHRKLVDSPFERFGDNNVPGYVFGVYDASFILSHQLNPAIFDFDLWTRSPLETQGKDSICAPKQIVVRLNLATEDLNSVKEGVSKGGGDVTMKSFLGAADRLMTLNESISLCVSETREIPSYRTKTDELYHITLPLEGLLFLAGMIAVNLSARSRRKK